MCLRRDGNAIEVKGWKHKHKSTKTRQIAANKGVTQTNMHLDRNLWAEMQKENHRR